MRPVIIQSTNLSQNEIRVWGQDPDTRRVVYDAIFTRHMFQTQDQFVTWMWRAVSAQMKESTGYVPMILQVTLPYQ